MSLHKKYFSKFIFEETNILVRKHKIGLNLKKEKDKNNF